MSKRERTLLIDDVRRYDVDVTARTYSEGIKALQFMGPFNRLYLDHDLGVFPEFRSQGGELSGYDVAVFLERHPDLLPDEIEIGSSNPSGSERIASLLRKLYEHEPRKGRVFMVPKPVPKRDVDPTEDVRVELARLAKVREDHKFSGALVAVLDEQVELLSIAVTDQLDALDSAEVMLLYFATQPEEILGSDRQYAEEKLSKLKARIRAVRETLAATHRIEES